LIYSEATAPKARCQWSKNEIY